ncbi:MAG: neutral/alkaline non-lysosomal ceramidase N-terminal domain-containing protein, partial [Patescibacteria group bacterium]|nr:neutral/alkaline non-lysosomal ceramidase N-terminal domain-containing protein [Patescibacteria group bacterium]
MRIGFASIDFTPPAGLPLMGNFRDDYAARGVHDPLLAKAMVFEDARGGKAAVLALDICMLNRDNVALIRRAIGRECSVPPENVLVHATHTHGAPAPCDKFLFGCDFEPYQPATEAFLARAATAVAMAEADLREGSL